MTVGMTVGVLSDNRTWRHPPALSDTVGQTSFTNLRRPGLLTSEVSKGAWFTNLEVSKLVTNLLVSNYDSYYDSSSPVHDRRPTNGTFATDCVR